MTKINFLNVCDTVHHRLIIVCMAKYFFVTLIVLTLAQYANCDDTHSDTLPLEPIPPITISTATAAYGQDYGGFLEEERERVKQASVKASIKALREIALAFDFYIDIQSVQSRVSDFYKGYIIEDVKGSVAYGWVLDIEVNVHGSKGDYIGYKRFRQLFKDRYLIGGCVPTVIDGEEICDLYSDEAIYYPKFSIHPFR